jgi:hypothetical protein
MKINELPIPFEAGSVYVRHSADGGANKNVAGVVTSGYVDLDGNSHFNVEEFTVNYGSPSHAYKSFRATSDLEFVSQSYELFCDVLDEVMNLVAQQAEAPEKKLAELNAIAVSADMAARISGQYDARGSELPFDLEDDE